MKENTVLAAFILAPVVLLVLLFLFFRRFRRCEKIPLWLRLIAGNSLVFLLLCSIVLFSGEVYYRFFNDTTDSFGLTKSTRRWFEPLIWSSRWSAPTRDRWFSKLPSRLTRFTPSALRSGV